MQHVHLNPCKKNKPTKKKSPHFSIFALCFYYAFFLFSPLFLFLYFFFPILPFSLDIDILHMYYNNRSAMNLKYVGDVCCAGGGAIVAASRAARFSILCIWRSIHSWSSSCWQHNTSSCSLCAAASSVTIRASSFPGCPGPGSACPASGFWHHCNNTTAHPTIW